MSTVCLCLCHAITDRQVREAVADGATRPKDVHAACACRAECGRCVRAMLALIRGGAQALGDGAVPAR